MIKYLLVGLLLPTVGLAAIPPNTIDVSNLEPQSQVSKKDREMVEMALKLPAANRVKALSGKGTAIRHALEEIAADPSQNLQNRWRAITSLGQLFPFHSQKVLNDAISSDKWFMRNAAAVALKHCERGWAIERAKDLLNDPALVVRTAAVQTLGHHNAVEANSLLWVKLYSKENYKAGRSLWIRKHIAEALAKMAIPGQEDKFVRLLHDADKKLYLPAMAGLKNATQLKMDAKLTPAQKRVSWINWYKNRSHQ